MSYDKSVLGTAVQRIIEREQEATEASRFCTLLLLDGWPSRDERGRPRDAGFLRSAFPEGSSYTVCAWRPFCGGCPIWSFAVLLRSAECEEFWRKMWEKMGRILDVCRDLSGCAMRLAERLREAEAFEEWVESICGGDQTQGAFTPGHSRVWSGNLECLRSELRSLVQRNDDLT